MRSKSMIMISVFLFAFIFSIQNFSYGGAEQDSITASELLRVDFISGAGGSLTGTLSQNILYRNDSSAVTAVPDSECIFIGWTAANGWSSGANPITVKNVTSAMTIKANFASPVKKLQNVNGATEKVGVCVDENGNLFFTGTFGGTRDFDPGAGTHIITANGLTDAFVTKFNSDGSYAWTQTFGGSDQDYGYKVTCYNGNVYATGYYYSTDAGIGGKGSVGGLGQISHCNAFVIALKGSNGSALTSFNGKGIVSFGGSGWDRGADIAASAGKVYVTGNFDSNNAGINGSGIFSTCGGYDCFILGLDAVSGVALAQFGVGGVKTFGGTGEDRGEGIAIDSGKIFVCGWTSSSNAGFNAPGAFSSTGSNDAFVISLDMLTGQETLGFGSSGFQKFGGSGADYGRALSISNGNIYVCGEFNSTNAGIGGAGTVSTKGGYDEYVFSLNEISGRANTSFGNQGIQTFGGSSGDQNIRGNAVLAHGSVIYLSGVLGSTDARLGTSGSYSTRGQKDSYIIALNTNGTIHSTFGKNGITTFGGGADDYAQGLAIYGQKLYAVGRFLSTDAVLNGSGSQFDALNYEGYCVTQRTSSNTVTFVSTSGTIEGIKSQTVNYGRSTSGVTAIPDSGYHFVNWTGGITSASNPLTVPNVTANMTVTANFAINTYTVTFDLAGKGARSGGGALSQTINHGSGAAAPTVTANPGWIFTGWDRTFDNITGNMTVTAQYLGAIYTVTFVEGTNGTITGNKVQTVNHGSSTIEVTAVPSPGYHFWIWTGDLISAANPLTIPNVTANMTITANFPINTYNVFFDLAGKSSRTGGGTLSQTINQGSAATAPTVVASAGWSFSGWDKAFDNISSELTVNAQYSAATYTVTYDAEGGTVSTPSKIVTYNAAYGTLEAPTRNGYTFAGWWTGDNGTGTQVTQMTTVSNTANHTIYAKWTANNYTVTYDTQGGTVSPAGKSVTFGSKYGVLASPARNGYAFAGWWTGLNGSGSKVSSATIVSNAANHSVYAKWVVSAVGVTLETPIPPEFVGVKVTVKGLPAGVRYDVSSGKIIGVPSKPGVYFVEISALGVPTQTITISAGALPLWAQGTFDGTVSLDLIDDADNWNNYPGTASMTVTSLGKITGKLSAGGKSCTFNAASYSPTDEDGVLGFQAIVKIGTTSVPLSFRVSQATAIQKVSVMSALLGSKADGTYEGTDIKCEIHMYRNVWKDSDMAAQLPDYAGYYTAVLPGGAEYGSGYLAMTVDRAGGVKTTGKLADGTTLSLSGTLIFRNEPACVFAVIYTSPTAYQGGCLFGLAKFAKPEGAGKMLLSILDEESLFRWESRNPQATAVYGDGGFSRELELVGGWYDKTGNLYDYYQDKDLSASADAGTSAPELIVGVNRYTSDCWKFSDIALTPVLKSGVMTGLAVLPKAGLPVNLGDNKWNYDAENTAALTIGLTRATGIFKGSFKAWFDYNATHTFRSILYEGVLTPDWEATNDFTEGSGFFLWADKSSYVNPLGRSVTYPFNWSYDFVILGDGK